MKTSLATTFGPAATLAVNRFGLAVGLGLVLGLGLMTLGSWWGGVTTSTLVCGPELRPTHVEQVAHHYRTLGRDQLSLEFYEPIDARREGLVPAESDHACLRYGWTDRVPSVIFLRQQAPPSLPVADISLSWESHQALPELAWLAPQLAMLLILLWRDRRPFVQLRQELRGPQWRLVGLAAATGLVLATLVMGLVARLWPEDVNLHYSSTSLLGIVLGILIINLLAPVVEELFFRGLLYQGLLAAGQPLSGAVLISLMFAGLHALALAPLLLAEGAYDALTIVYLTTLAGSALLCLLYWRFRNLLLCVGFHGAYNLAMLIMALLLVP